jgi:hypothetical protein
MVRRKWRFSAQSRANSVDVPAPGLMCPVTRQVAHREFACDGRDRDCPVFFYRMLKSCRMPPNAVLLNA